MERAGIPSSRDLQAVLSLLALAAGGAVAKEATDPGRAMVVAMVLLPRPALPAPEAVVKALGAIDPSLRLRAGEKKKDVQAWDLGGVDTFVSLMPIPIPNREAELALKSAAFALANAIESAPHAAHLIVAGRWGSDWRSLSTFTRFVAAVAQASGASFVYWGAGHVTQPAAHFIEVAREDDLPIELWTGVSMARPGSRVSLLSLGMDQFRLPDLLVEAPVEQSGFAIKLVYDLLDTIVRDGKPIPEGDTVGRTAGEKMTVLYRPSPIDPSTRVWTVVVP